MNFLNPSNWTRTTGPKPQQKAAVAEWAVSRAQSPSQTKNTLRPSNTNPPLLSQTKHKVIFHIQLPKETPPNTLTPPHTDLTQADRLQQPRNVMAPSGFAHPLYQPSCGRKMGQLQKLFWCRVSLRSLLFLPTRERQLFTVNLCLISYLNFLRVL